MPVPTIEWHKGKVKIIDQTKLPRKLTYLYCKDVTSIWRAIKRLQVRGAPALGIAAAFGVVLGIKDSKAKTYEEFKEELISATENLATARPTAINLFWALDRMKKVTNDNRDKSIPELKDLLLSEALKIMEEDKEICRKIGQNGAGLIEDGDTILTHCNAGALATADYGTALGIIYRAKEDGKDVKVYVDESRPLLQGVRLTTWELMREGVDVTLICDGMAGRVMKEGKISKVFVGADRVVASGDCANKIGTYNLAVLAHTHQIPFYIACPTSSFDLTLASGDEIPIEERAEDEVTTIYGQRVAPVGVKVYNPAFDVTPASLISAIVTEVAIARAPYKESLRQMVTGNPKSKYQSPK